jgi:chondroitin AC lyase
MQLKRRELTGQKAWFFFDDEMVALGTGITNSSEIPVVTTVNQCLLRGQVARGNIPTARYRWLHHDGVGYLFPNSTTTPPDLPRITLSTEARSGAWTDIGPGPERTDTRRIFNLHLEHGAHPTDSRYVYIVLPNAATDDVARWAQRPPIELLANSNAHQAIYHKTLKMVMAAFAQPGEVQTPLGAIGVDQPCLLIVRGDKLTVSNPLNKPLTVQVTVNGKAQTVTLPDGPLAGSSVKLSL